MEPVSEERGDFVDGISTSWEFEAILVCGMQGAVLYPRSSLGEIDLLIFVFAREFPLFFQEVQNRYNQRIKQNSEERIGYD